MSGAIIFAPGYVIGRDSVPAATDRAHKSQTSRQGHRAPFEPRLIALGISCRALLRERESLERQQEDLLDSMAQLQQQLDQAAAAQHATPTPAPVPPAAAEGDAPTPVPGPSPSAQNISHILRCQKEALQAQFEASITVRWPQACCRGWASSCCAA